MGDKVASRIPIICLNSRRHCQFLIPVLMSSLYVPCRTSLGNISSSRAFAMASTVNRLCSIFDSIRSSYILYGSTLLDQWHDFGLSSDQSANALVNKVNFDRFKNGKQVHSRNKDADQQK